MADAIKVLDHYRDQFIEEMNANSVVHELYHEKIITDGDHQAITANRSRKEQNSLLHLSLKNCTDEVFKKACQIFIKSGEHGNARMKALGEQMVEAMNEAKKQSLVTELFKGLVRPEALLRLGARQEPKLIRTAMSCHAKSIVTVIG